ncbi:exocyst complex component exo70 [Lecanora helva]
MVKTQNAAHVEEKAEVEVLCAQGARLVDTEKKILALRARLIDGGKTVKDALGPVNKNTRDDQVMMRNIDKIDAQIDKMLEPGQDKAQEERIIRAGLVKVGVAEYMASMKRLERALTQMTMTNLRANQQAIGDFNEMLNIGRHSLEESFRADLPFPVITQEQASHLGAIDKSISSPNARNAASNQRESPSVRIYSDSRGPYLVSSLQGLSIASISTSKRKNTEEPYRQGTSAIGTYAKAIEGLFLAELQNIALIMPREDWSIAMETTTRKALADLAKTLRELNMYVKQNLITDCFLAYEIIEKVTKVAYQVNSAAEDIKLPFAEALKPIRETAKASLPELIEDQRRRVGEIQILPANGSTLPFTTETMKRMQTLTDNRNSLSSILTSLGDGNWTHQHSTTQQTNSSSSLPSLKSLDVGADGTQLLAHYILDTLDTHITSLETRARTLLKSKATHGVFLSNTVATIDKMIRSSDLDALLSHNPTAASKLDAWRKKGTSIYMDSWREPSSALFDVQYTNRSGGPRPQSGSTVHSAEVVKALSSKDKDAIKEKWKLFNASFDECVKRHREMSGAMEREVKSNLSREVTNMVEPLYARFWDRYEALDRGRGKYVKYDKGQLSAILASLG